MSPSEPPPPPDPIGQPTPPESIALIGRLLDERADSLVLYASQWTDEAEDCVQEALVALAQQVPLPHSPVAWLYRVVKHRALNHIRSDKRRKRREATAWQNQLVHQTSQQDSSSQQGDRIDLLEALTRIEPEAREIVLLHIEAGLTFALIGEVLELSTSAAHRRYYLALRSLRRHLEPNNPTVSKPTSSSRSKKR